MARESFAYLAEFTMGWLQMPRLAKQADRYLAIEGVDLILEGLKKKKGAMLILSHGGHWEAAALIAGLLIARPAQTRIHALARPLKNPYLYRYILRLRGLTGLQSISKVGAVRETLKCLKRNEIVSLLFDQRVNQGSVEVTFFGRPALTTSLPALVALRAGTPLFYVHTRLTPELRYVLNVKGPLPVEETGEADRDLRVNTQRFNDYLEAEIRKAPGRWLWMHNRWRVRHGAKE